MYPQKNTSSYDLTTINYNNLGEKSPGQNMQRSFAYRESESTYKLTKNSKILEEFMKAFKVEQANQEQTQQLRSLQFKQQWQTKRKQKYQLKYTYFFRENMFYLSFSMILLISQIVLLWFLSVFRVFKCEDNRFIFDLCCAVQFFDLVLKSSYLVLSSLKQSNQNLFEIKLTDWLEIYIGNVYCIIYSILGMTQVISSTSDHLFLVFDIVAIVFNYYRMEAIQNDIKTIKSSLEFKNYIKLFNLMCTLIMIIHFFAVLMHFSTDFTHSNYLSDLEMGAQKTWINFYIYSFYFSGTTVLTVGYGDIIPKNILQIFIVLLMQIFGVVMIVYLNGEVGNILCQLRREKENLENDLSVLERLKSSFKLSLETTQKIKQFLIDNRRADQENKIHQEKALLGKISSGLREQATLTNQVNIIKQSLFLLSNFSTKAHILISNKLISRIYSPNECINQVVGNENLYFIKKGQVCFYISKNDHDNYYSRKIIKRIKVSKDQKPECNCFGYVSSILGKKNRLKAYSKDFSDLYSIQKAHFMDAINCDNQDFETFHKMRQSYMSEKNPQKNEAPNFFDEKDHFVCETSKVVAQYLGERFKSKRKNMLRIFKKRKLIIEMTKNNTLNSETDNESEFGSFTTDRYQTDLSNGLNMVLSLKQRKIKYQQVEKQKTQGYLSKNLIVQRKYTKRYCKKKNNEGKQIQEFFQAEGANFRYDSIDTGTSFAYFYPDSNIEMVMRKLNYYLNVLSIFTNMFERTLEQANKGKEYSLNNGDVAPGSNIENYRMQKDFIQFINIRL